MALLVNRILIRGIIIVLANGCNFVDTFRKSKSKAERSVTSGAELGTVIGEPLGSKAYGQNDTELAALYAVSTSHPPAPIRPDADVHFRRLLLQFRSEGSQVARLIGEVEAYRDLLGGASKDFSKKPLEDYDATSLLALIKASELICESLVAPTPDKHGNWQTALPQDPSEVTENITFLYQRLTGSKNSDLDATTLSSLKSVLTTWSPGGIYDASSYVPVCVAISVDGEALFL